MNTLCKRVAHISLPTAQAGFASHSLVQEGSSPLIAVQGAADKHDEMQSSTSTSTRTAPEPNAISAESGMWTRPRPLLYRCHTDLHACTHILISLLLQLEFHLHQCASALCV